MRMLRLALAATALTVASAPAAWAGNQCKPYFQDEQVGPVTVTTVGVAC